MGIAARYLLRQFASASAVVFLALLATWCAADGLLHLDGFAADAAGTTRRILLRALDIIPFGIPLACVAGAAWSFTSAVRHREVTAIRSGGIPLRRTLVPVLLTCLLVSGGLVLVEDRVLVSARDALRVLEDPEASTGIRGRPRFSNGRWWYATESSVFSAQEHSPEEGRLLGVSVFEFDATRSLRRRIEAAEARSVEKNTWEFRDATVLRFDTARRLESRTHAALRVDLGLSGTDLARAATPPEATSLHRLARRIRRSGADARQRAPLEIAFHGRIAGSLAVLALVLITIPIAVGNPERGDSLARTLLRALAATGVYWLVWTLAVYAAGTGAVPPAVLLWPVPLLFLAVGAWRFRAVRE